MDWVENKAFELEMPQVYVEGGRPSQATAAADCQWARPEHGHDSDDDLPSEGFKFQARKKNWR